MAHILSVLLALAPVQAQMTYGTSKGTSYLVTKGSSQASKYKKMSSNLPPEKYTQCLQSDQEDQSLQDFTVQNIEKTKMVSFSDKKYRDKVTLVVNLASF